jgi:ABC-2 type transport system permease protein
MSLSQINPVNSLLLTLHVTKVRFRILSRYKGWFAFDFIMPIVMAALPILIGVSVAGGPTSAARAFKSHTGTSNYVIYLLIGSIVMMTVDTSMWLVGNWLRWERETGTIESIYLTPARRLQILTGVSLYSGARAIITFIGAYIAGALLFRIDP